MVAKKILLTGANGFLGTYIKSALAEEGDIDTIGRSTATYKVDLALAAPTLNKSYDLVVHSAGKAHLLPSDSVERQQFFDVNVQGTEHLLYALEASESLPKAFVFISSVAVYGLQMGVNIAESHPLKATEPYGKSKILAEELVTAWCTKNKVSCTILRLPLIVGKNAPGNLKSMKIGIAKGYYFNIAGGIARKSMVLAQDVAKLIVEVAQVGGVYNLTDGYHPNFKELSIAIAEQLNKPAPSFNIPLSVAKLLGKIGDLFGGRFPIDSQKVNKITSDLTFNDDKARAALNWNPTSVIKGLEL